MKITQSYPPLCDPMDCSLPGSCVHGDSPGKNTGVGSHSLLQGIFPTQGLKSSLLLCRWILNLLRHQGSPKFLRHTFKKKIYFFIVVPFSCDLNIFLYVFNYWNLFILQLLSDNYFIRKSWDSTVAFLCCMCCLLLVWLVLLHVLQLWVVNLT